MSFHFRDFKAPSPRRTLQDFIRDTLPGETLKSCPTRPFSQFEHPTNLELLQKLDAALQEHGLPAKFPERARDHHVLDDLHAFVAALEHTAALNKAHEDNLTLLEIEDSQALRKGSETLSMLSACFGCRDLAESSSDPVVFVERSENDGRLRRVKESSAETDSKTDILQCRKWGETLADMRKQYQALSIQAPQSGWRRS